MFGTSTLDREEVEKFSKIASEWWNERGKFRPLHQINPLRVTYIRDLLSLHYGPVTPPQQCLKGLNILDIGCGGGLLSEPLARLGASVTAIDASEKNIAVAKQHAEKMGLYINYKTATPEELVAGDERFHAVIAMEVVEHVANVPQFFESCEKLMVPNGMFFLSTLNRTMKAYLYAIIGAEYLLRWLPPGTHEWARFLTPSEVAGYLRSNELQLHNMKGISYNPLRNQWSLSEHLDVNYMLCATKAEDEDLLAI